MDRRAKIELLSEARKEAVVKFDVTVATSAHCNHRDLATCLAAVTATIMMTIITTELMKSRQTKTHNLNGQPTCRTTGSCGWSFHRNRNSCQLFAKSSNNATPTRENNKKLASTEHLLPLNYPDSQETHKIHHHSISVTGFDCDCDWTRLM